MPIFFNDLYLLFKLINLKNFIYLKKIIFLKIKLIFKIFINNSCIFFVLN